MPPWPFGTSRSGSPRANNTPEAIDARNADYFTTQQTFNAAYLNQARDNHDLEPPVPLYGPRGSQPGSSGHTRSLSSTILGRKRTPTKLDTLQRSNQSEHGEAWAAGAGSPRRADARLPSGELDSGTCATCAAKGTWPRGVAEYRCPRCLMVNDLENGSEERARRREPEQTFGRAGSFPGTGPNRRVLPLSVERTQRIINHCIDHYLDQVMHISTNVETQNSDVQLQGSERSLPSSDVRHPSRLHVASASSVAPSSVNSGLDRPSLALPSRSRRSENETTRHTPSSLKSLPPPPERFQLSYNDHVPVVPERARPPLPRDYSTEQEHAIPRKPVSSLPRVERRLEELTSSHCEEILPPAKSIFKPLEEYIALSFGQHDSLNRSFSSVQPRARNENQNEEATPTRVGQTEPSKDHISYSQTPELDPKMLMIGDVAENGSWWTGRALRETSHSSTPKPRRDDDNTSDLVHSRSPNIEWAEVTHWFQIVLQAGDGWRERRSARSGNSIHSNDTVMSSAFWIDKSFLEGRIHLQKTLLKASDTLLKRPGCPLKGPGDARFLLILLANPLLYPSSLLPAALKAGRELDSFKNNQEEPQRSEKPDQSHPKRPSALSPPSGYWEQGYAQGILKRIFGLLSNLSHECHRHLSAWFARYKEDRFRQIVELTQSYVTYRLSRQHSRKRSQSYDISNFIPQLSGTGTETSAQLHAALGLGSQPTVNNDSKNAPPAYGDDWQIKAAARVMALLYNANRNFLGERTNPEGERWNEPVPLSRHNTKRRSRLLSNSDFYNLKVDFCDLVADFESWESSSTKFSFCQYPFFFSVGSKIKIMEHDARRQMDIRAREAFFDSVLRNKTLQQYLFLKVRRECLVEDSLTAISEVVGQGQEEIKKGLRIQFAGEEGVDAGGLRKEWFLLLVRDIFDPDHGMSTMSSFGATLMKSTQGMFIYDDESNLCYFNPHSFETSDQYFLVGALLGLAIYNSTILDIAFPPFLFKKLLSAGPAIGKQSALNKTQVQYSLQDLAEFRPALARGLKQLLEFDGDVQETFCRDFVAEVDRYGSVATVPLCSKGLNRQVTNSNRQEFVDLYTRYLLDTQVSRQFEPFKRGFFTVCGGNALSLFQPEEIELLIRGSDEPLDVLSLKAVAVYDNWRRNGRQIENPAEEVNVVRWFWEYVESADTKTQRKVLGFITGSDRIPAMGAASLTIKIAYGGNDFTRFPVARTCFNLLLLYDYRTKEELISRLLRAVSESEGFGLK